MSKLGCIFKKMMQLKDVGVWLKHFSLKANCVRTARYTINRSIFSKRHW